MKTFITYSESSKKILNVALMSSNLPVNIMIIGEVGVGKKILAQTISNNTSIFDARVLEEAIIHKTANLEQYNELIITNIDLLLNKTEFMEYLKDIKVIATAQVLTKEIESLFAVKIDIPPLKERKEDLEELIKIYSNEIKEIYNSDIDIKDIEIDLSTNGISLKNSIYKNTIVKSINKDDISNVLENYFQHKLKDGKTYKDLLEIFEIPLLKAAKNEYKSQLQMANKLNINRITLRKKLDLYFGDN